MAEAQDGLIGEFERARRQLLETVAGVSEEQFKRRPELQPGELPDADPDAELPPGWCIAEVLAHLLASHRLQARRIEALAGGHHTITGEAEAAGLEEAARRGRAAPVPQLIHGLLAVFREIEKLLQGPAGAAQEGDIPALMRHEVIQVERAHTRRIEAIKALLGAGRASQTG